MATVFTKIIEGELPGRFVWRDDRCVAFLSINPLRHGHTLVVPLEEVDHWLDLDPDLNAHVLAVGQRIGQAQMAALSPTRVGLIIAGMMPTTRTGCSRRPHSSNTGTSTPPTATPTCC